MRFYSPLLRRRGMILSRRAVLLVQNTAPVAAIDYGRTCYCAGAEGRSAYVRHAQPRRPQTRRHKNCGKNTGEIKEDRAMALLPIIDRNRTIASLASADGSFHPRHCASICASARHAFSVFNLPMTKLIGITAIGPRRLEANRTRLDFSIAIFFLGVSAAIFGRWVEEAVPAKRCSRPACASAVGFFISAHRRLSAQSLDHLSRLRRNRRNSASALATSRRSRR